MRISTKTGIFAGGVIAVLAMAFTLLPVAEVQGGSGCEGDEKQEGNRGHFVAPDGKSIDFVCIKAGRDVFIFECGETDKDGCYDLQWTVDSEGCCSEVVIGGGGTGRDCKTISHTAATFADGDCKKDPDPDPKPK